MDKRYENTKIKLYNSLVNLLKRKELLEISISELCRNANIQRNTFYDHYDSISDLIEDIVCSYELEALETISETAPNKDFDSMITKTINTIYNDNNLRTILTIPAFSNIYLSRLSKKCNDMVIRKFPVKNNVDKEMYIYANRYATGGTIILIYDWISSGLKEQPLSIIKKIVNFSQNILDMYLK